MSSGDLYAVLEVDKHADDETIKKSYKSLARKWHPDKNPDNRAEAEHKFKELTEAFGILSDPDKRKMYDMGGLDALKGSSSDDMGVNPFDIFSQMMGGFGGGRQEGYENVVTHLSVSLNDLYTGKTIEQPVERFVICHKCNGKGTKNGVVKLCPKCSGNGMCVGMLGGKIPVQMPCDACGTSGIDSNVPKCGKCKGNTCFKETVTLSVNIPKGGYEKKPIIIENEGNAIPDDDIPKIGKAKTNAIFVIHEEPHDVFKREFARMDTNTINYADLMTIIKVSFAESIVGFSRKIRHLNGKDVTIKMNSSVRHGDIFVVTGYGLPVLSDPEKYGDLFVRIETEHPSELKLTSGNKQRVWQILTGEALKMDDVKHKNVLHCIPYDTYAETHKALSPSSDSEDEKEGKVQCAQQ